MGKKNMKKRKGQWIAISASVLMASSMGLLTVDAQETTYTVKAGDTLWSIATRNNLSLSELKQLNNLTSNDILPNQVLKVSATNQNEVATEEVTTNTEVPVTTTTETTVPTTTTTTTITQASPSNTSADNGTYTIKAGDTLNKIAAQTGVTVEQLRQWNHLTGNLIFPNQTLVVKTPTTTTSNVSRVQTTTTTNASEIRPNTNVNVTTTTQSANQAVSRTQEAIAAAYVIKRGDTLNKIAAAHGVTVSQLQQWNNISGSLIYPNQRLVVKAPTTTVTRPTTSTTSTTRPTVTTPVVKETETTVKETTTTTTVVTPTTYTIKAGDTLNKIAATHGVTVSQLQQWNNISGSLIYPNQRLVVKAPTTTVTRPTTSTTRPTVTTPVVKETETTVKETTTTTTVVTPTTYTIKAGDTLNKIAAAHGVTVSQLQQWNNISGSLIYPNQRLVVKAPTTTVTRPATSTTRPTVTTPVVKETETTVKETTTTTTVVTPTTYTIKAGDTLNKIAAAHGVTVSQLREWNKISGNLIYPNQKIVVKAPTITTDPTTVKETTTVKEVDPNAGTVTTETTIVETVPVVTKNHTVVSGDTLYGIARKYGVSVNDLMKWNKLSSAMISAGQKLNVSNPTTLILNESTQGNTISVEEASRLANEKLRLEAVASMKPGDKLVEIDAPYDGNLIKKYHNDSRSEVALTTVANRYGVTVSQLRQWNPVLFGNVVKPDQEIVVADPESGNPAALGLATKNYLVINEASEQVTSQGIQQVLNWFENRVDNTYYSMNHRNGPNSYDCSSAVFYALMSAGYLKQGTYVGNTDSLFALENKLLTPISASEVRAGDIFVSGKKFNSAGSAGHTGVAINNKEIYHSTYNEDYHYDGIVRSEAKGRMGDASNLPVYWYRLNEAYRLR